MRQRHRQDAGHLNDGARVSLTPMSQHFSVWLLIALGFLAANLPFLNQRVLAFWRVGSLVNAAGAAAG
ncbi:MAG: DUF2818 family protein [Burkholderiaceae bacterium]